MSKENYSEFVSRSNVKLDRFTDLFLAVVSLPTLGYVVRVFFTFKSYVFWEKKFFFFYFSQDRHRLETYEDFSEERFGDLDFFNNLTFRFSCEGKPIGLYADLEYDCRIFHACDDSGNGFPVVCPNDTFFDQRERVCSDEGHVDCKHANEW